MDLSIVINESAKKENWVLQISMKHQSFWTACLFTVRKRKSNRLPGIKLSELLKNMCTQHLSKGYEPMIFFYYKEGFSSGLLVCIVPDKKQEAIDFLRKIYNESCGNELPYTFLKDEVLSIYKEDKQLVSVASLFAIIAILISAMGLFSLSLFDIQQRFHEISIRKINGATTKAIWQMLFIKYSQLYGIACLVGLPFILAGHHFIYGRFCLQSPYCLVDFCHRDPFLTGGISFLTLIWQIRKAARTNPVEIIRSE